MMTEGIWEIIASTGMDEPRGLFLVPNIHRSVRHVCPM